MSEEDINLEAAKKLDKEIRDAVAVLQEHQPPSLTPTDRLINIGVIKHLISMAVDLAQQIHDDVDFYAAGSGQPNEDGVDDWTVVRDCLCSAIDLLDDVELELSAAEDLTAKYIPE